uniref:NADH dehydrogenase subunit 6 n=1 Tax=Dendropoma corrodens TaxID=169304 RepID=A0A075QTA4_9CAEN|nr:NADH dehydrogenase subunit 6 [Dendropoma corrodens]
MTIVLFALLMAAFVLLLPAMSQPLTLGLVILIMTLGGGGLCGLLMSPWYGYLLFLVYVGGLLVMFVYVAALVPNVIYGINYNYVILLVLGLLGLMFLFKDYLLDSGLMAPESNEWDSYLGIELCTAGGLLVGLAHILLVTMVAVVKICYTRGGALRAFKFKEGVC